MARRRPSAPRSRANSASDGDDVFVEKTLAVTGWAQRNRQLLVALTVALVVVAAGALYYLSYRRAHLEQAGFELERAQQAAAFGDTATAKVELAQYVEAFGGTPYADEARLLLGQLYLASGQTDLAISMLEDAADVSDPLGLQIAMLLASAYEESGELDEAERLFLRAADRARLDFQVREALEDAARVRRLQGRLAGAAELYQRILDDLEDDASERGFYEMRLQELRTASNG